jgi:hypothetical protein
MNQSFLSQQHGQSAPAQPHNMNLIPGPNQAMNFLPNAHSSNGPFPSNHPMSRIRSDNRQREMLAQSQRATAGGAQTGPSVINGVIPAQPSGVGYPGMGPQNGQGPQRVATQPVGVGPLATSHAASHPANAPIGLAGGLPTQRTGPQSQPQSQMGMRAAQPSLPGQPLARPPSMSVSNMRGPGGTVPPGIIGNVSQQTQPQQGYHMTIGGPGTQPPSQASQGPATSISQSMHRPLSTERANSFGAMPGFSSGPFSQGTSHPPPTHMAGPNPANQFNFMRPASSPSQPIDMGHNLSSGGAGPSGVSPTRPDFTPTPAQLAASSMQHGPGVPSGSGGPGMNEGFPTFTTMPPARPSSSSHSALGLPHQQAQTPQGPSHPTPPRQQTPHQQPHMSPAHLPERFTAPVPNPARPQSQPQRPSSQQQMGPSLTPQIPGTLPPDATLFQGPPPTSISSGSAPPPRPNIGSTVGAGPPPLTPVSSAENGDPSRQSAPGIRQPMPRFV